MLSGENVREFAKFVRDAPNDAYAERFVRTMLKGVAASCPMDVLVQLAACVIQCRRDELRGEAEQN